MHYLLEVKKDENIGMLGTFLKGKSNRPHFDGVFNSRGFAHDILEHSYTQIGNPIEDELMALGGFYYIRVLGGYSRTDKDSLASSIYGLLEDIGMDFYITAPKQYRINDKEYNDAIATAVKKGINIYTNTKYPREEGRINLTLQQIKYLKGWICKGFSYTKARYRGFDSCDLVYRFNTIEKELARLYNSIAYKGQQFKVNINLHANTVKWSEIHEEYYN